MPSSSRSAPTVSRCWRASRSVGASSAPWRPARAVGGQRVGRDRGLARADVALEEPEHRGRPGEVVTDGGHRGRLVGGQLDRPADAPRERADDRGPDRPVRGPRRAATCGAASRTRCRRRSTIPSWSARSSSKASRRRAASRPSNDVRVVGLLDRAGDRHERFLRAMIAAGRYSGYALPGGVERLANGATAAEQR